MGLHSPHKKNRDSKKFLKHSKSPNSLNSSRSSLNDNLDLMSVGVDNFSYLDEREKVLSQMDFNDIQPRMARIDILKSEGYDEPSIASPTRIATKRVLK